MTSTAEEMVRQSLSVWFRYASVVIRFNCLAAPWTRYPGEVLLVAGSCNEEEGL